MSAKTFGIAYIATFIVFVALDFIWLSSMANRLYKPTLGDMLASDFRLLPAVFFYLIFVAGLVFFAVRPGLLTGNWLTALTFGAAYGFCCYATYDLTNQATLKNWSTTLTVADLIWGSLLSAVSASAGYKLTRVLDNL